MIRLFRFWRISKNFPENSLSFHCSCYSWWINKTFDAFYYGILNESTIKRRLFSNFPCGSFLETLWLYQLVPEKGLFLMRRHQGDSQPTRSKLKRSINVNAWRYWRSNFRHSWPIKISRITTPMIQVMIPQWMMIFRKCPDRDVEFLFVLKVVWVKMTGDCGR